MSAWPEPVREAEEAAAREAYAASHPDDLDSLLPPKLRRNQPREETAAQRGLRKAKVITS